MVRGLSAGYDKVMEVNFEEGRYFTEAEMQSGLPVILLGNDLAHNLFPDIRFAIGKPVSAFGRKLRVAGVLQKEGQGLGMDGGQDLQAFVPVNFLRTLGSFEGAQYNPTILVKAPRAANFDEFEQSLHWRSKRSKEALTQAG